MGSVERVGRRQGVIVLFQVRDRWGKERKYELWAYQASEGVYTFEIIDTQMDESVVAVEGTDFIKTWTLVLKKFYGILLTEDNLTLCGGHNEQTEGYQ